MKKIFLIILFLSIFMPMHLQQSGKEVVYGNGVEFIRFDLEPSEISSDESTTAIIFVENKGEMDATNVSLRALTLIDWLGNQNKVVYIPSLYKANPSIGLERGQIYSYSWNLDPPGYVGKLSYTFKVRLVYQYKTIGEGLIKAVSSTYFRQTGEKGGLISFSYTKGPLIIQASPISSIVAEYRVPIRIEIKNIGKGRTFLIQKDFFKECSKFDEECFKNLSLEKIEKNIDKILIKEGKNLDCFGNEKSKDVRLIKGERYILTCEIKADIQQSLFKNINFGIIVEYWYFIEDSRVISIR